LISYDHGVLNFKTCKLILEVNSGKIVFTSTEEGIRVFKVGDNALVQRKDGKLALYSGLQLLWEKTVQL
jgi:hypothetical protein